MFLPLSASTRLEAPAAPTIHYDLATNTIQILNQLKRRESMIRLVGVDCVSRTDLVDA